MFRHGGDRKAVDAQKSVASCDSGRERTGEMINRVG